MSPRARAAEEQRDYILYARAPLTSKPSTIKHHTAESKVHKRQTQDQQQDAHHDDHATAAAAAAAAAKEEVPLPPLQEQLQQKVQPAEAPPSAQGTTPL